MPPPPETADDGPPRVLYVTHRVPFPPDKGDRIRNYHVLRQLAGRARVWLLALADEPVPDATRAELGRLCERVEYAPIGGWRRKGRMMLALAGVLGRRAGAGEVRPLSLSAAAHTSGGAAGVVRAWVAEAGFGGAVVSAGSLAEYLGGSGNDRSGPSGLAGATRVVDLVDVDSQKWLDFAAATRSPILRRLYRLEAGRTRAEERALAGWADAVTLVSRHEADVFDSFTHPGTATVATNGVDLDYFRPTPDTPEAPACVFTGAMDYLPNIDAAGWFAAEVWPEVLRRHPGAEFRVVGRKPAPAVLKLASRPGVTVVGQVPDVRPHVASAAVAVVPMRLSRGLQNKVLEALAMGKAVVAAPPALAALRAEPGTHLLAATTPAEWADAVCRLLASPARRAELGRAGRRFVEDHHHWDRCLRPLVERVVGARAAAPSPTP